MEHPQFNSQTQIAFNQPKPLENYNMFTSDIALNEAVIINGANWALDDLTRYGAHCGLSETLALGDKANKNPPCLQTHDRYGHRVDLVEFDTAYHQLSQSLYEEGLHSSAWLKPGPGAHVMRTAKAILNAQVEQGHGCPATMVFSAPAVIEKQANLAKRWLPLILASSYDPRNVPIEQKKSVTIGMALTEKQSGSDVRANSTRAEPVNIPGAGNLYVLTGHKYFVSGPMSDAFMILAYAKGGLSCFLVPRWRPDGTKNPIEIQQLKQKMGNVSNATAETELRGACGWLIAQEGEGLKTILNAVSLTRFDCVIGSTAGMRAAVSQVINHCEQRKAFGHYLSEQPLMQNVIADLVIESEAATALIMRLARALDNSEHNESEKKLARIGIAIAKYWVCKRTPEHAYEAMECIGGMGTMENTMMPRLYREAPINPIWEGSGNVQALDILRAMSKDPASLEAFMALINQSKGRNSNYDSFVQSMEKSITRFEAQQYRARSIAEQLALSLQAAILLEGSSDIVANAFCHARLNENRSLLYGNLPVGTPCAELIHRASPIER